MPQTLAAILPYIPPGLARVLLPDPTLVPRVEQFPAAVLFADISGFTPLTEALAQRGAEGPEEMTRLLNAYFSRLIVAIEAEGGEVVKFSGDALTALFPATAEPRRRPPRCAVPAMHASWTISPPCRPALAPCSGGQNRGRGWYRVCFPGGRGAGALGVRVAGDPLCQWPRLSTPLALARPSSVPKRRRCRPARRRQRCCRALTALQIARHEPESGCYSVSCVSRSG
jgi:hypothetical protein